MLQGMLDAQLVHLAQVLTNKRIWALNVGENFQISINGWARFTKALEQTAVGYMYVSEHHLKHTDLKIRMRDVIRVNRKCGPHICAQVQTSSPVYSSCKGANP